MGPAPAVAVVRRAVRAALGERRVLVACSGGADSLALAAAAAFEAPRGGVSAGLVTVDHGLQSGSDAQARAVIQLGYELGFDPVELIRVRVGRAGGVEAAARTARYGALDRVAGALDADVLLGHTLDDQAETVLLGLGRGSGPRSIAGMRAVEGRYRRPFLGIRRATTQAACAALGLTPWQDPHNADPSYQRVRLRREVLPLLEDVLHGGIAEALARTAALVQEDLDALDEFAALDETATRAVTALFTVINSRRAAAPRGTTRVDQLDVAALAEVPRAIRTRVLRAWVHAQGVEPLTAERTTELDALITGWHGQGPIDVPGGFEVARVSGRLSLRRKSVKG